MTRKELEKKLKELGYLDLYSLDGSVGPDRVVLYKNYSVWEVFYIDERGNRTVPKLFSSEEEAYDYLYKEAVDMYELLHKDYGTAQDEIQPSTTVRGDNFEMTYTEPKSEKSRKKD